MSSDVEARVRRIIVEHLGVRADTMVDTATFEELGADSLDTVGLSMSFEEEFGIEIPPEVDETLRTVGDAVNAVTKIVSKG